MSSLNPEQIIAPTVLTTGAVALYTVPVNTVTVVRRLTFCNTTAAAHTFTVYYTPSAGVVDATTMLINAERLGPTRTVSPPELEGLVLEAGDQIWIKADANSAITVMGAATEIA